ncbi:MAG: hypothetical protein RMJ87_10985 [Cytophagales bacterium]|nr:hypothetical protein [Bernardetiaceae bacterium]MDW8205545.1 hypothetical protein [Cytophagales bacterium]
MMKQIDAYPHTVVWYDDAQRFMKCERFCKAEEFIWDADYKDQMMRLVALVQEKQPLYILMDLRQFFYPVNPEQQQWINEKVIPPILATGVLKGAFVLPTDIIAALSIEQIYDTEAAASLPVRMFTNYQKALDWLGVQE